jgi:hypothetical protein
MICTWHEYQVILLFSKPITNYIHFYTRIKNSLISVGMWRWYINITITILDIIHRPIFYYNSAQLYRFVRTSQETHYACTTQCKRDSVRSPQESHNIPLQNESEILFVPHRNHITSPLQNASEIQFVPHRNHITSPLRSQQVNAVGHVIAVKAVSCYCVRVLSRPFKELWRTKSGRHSEWSSEQCREAGADYCNAPDER